MIDVITPDNYAEHRDVIRDTFRMRYRVFKERLDWNVATVTGEERDEFDEQGPTYVVSRDARGRTIGAVRLLPTTGPNMLRDVFPELLDGKPAPAAYDVWETSRFAVDHESNRSNSLAALSSITSELFCGSVEYCLAVGIRQLVCVHDIRFLRVIRRVGCRPRWTSPHRPIGGLPTMYSWIVTNQSFLEKLRQVAGITHSVIRHAPWINTRSAA